MLGNILYSLPSNNLKGLRKLGSCFSSLHDPMIRNDVVNQTQCTKSEFLFITLKVKDT